MAEWDILNWQAMIIELSIAGAVAIGLSIFFYRRQEKERKRIDSIIIEQDKSKKTRQDFSINVIRSYLPDIEYLINECEQKKKELLENLKQGRPISNILADNLEFLKNDLKNLKFQVSISADVLEPHHVEEMRHLIETIEEYSKFDLDFDAKPNVAGIIANIKSILLNWPNPRV